MFCCIRIANIDIFYYKCRLIIFKLIKTIHFTEPYMICQNTISVILSQKINVINQVTTSLLFHYFTYVLISDEHSHPHNNSIALSHVSLMSSYNFSLIYAYSSIEQQFRSTQYIVQTEYHNLSTAEMDKNISSSKLCPYIVNIIKNNSDKFTSFLISQMHAQNKTASRLNLLAEKISIFLIIYR